MAKKHSDLEWAMIGMMRLLEHPNPGFICVPAGSRQTARCLVRVRHSSTEMASLEDRSWLRKQLGKTDKPWQYLYALSDGMLLFEPLIPRFERLTESRDGGFRYYPIREMRSLAIEARSLKDHDGNRGEIVLPFAEVPLSGNMICIKSVRGRWFTRKNEQVEINHDCPPGGFGIPKDLVSLICILCGDPAFFLYMCGCYTRYSDGKSDTQWIPIRYVGDVSKLDQVDAEPYPKWWKQQ